MHYAKQYFPIGVILNDFILNYCIESGLKREYMKLESIRKEYKFAELSENHININPFKQFEIWMNEALHAKINEPTAMSVSTLGNDGFPQSRIVLLKDYSENGFVFFTNYHSQKGNAIAEQPKVSLLFFWPELERQIRISGIAQKTASEVSDRYFASRPIGSQLSAMVSGQSKKIPSRKFLEDKLDQLKSELANESPKRPENWGGFRVIPVKFEFWQGRENRLHDRILFEKENNKWIISRLAP